MQGMGLGWQWCSYGLPVAKHKDFKSMLVKTEEGRDAFTELE